jgi:hypothetical protein
MSGETHMNGADPQLEADDRDLPVVQGEVRTIERPSSESAIPAPAVAATGGFLAGIATLVLVRLLRRSASRQRRGGVAIRRSKRGDRSLEIAGSRSFLVDVHVLKR